MVKQEGVRLLTATLTEVLKASGDGRYQPHADVGVSFLRTTGQVETQLDIVQLADYNKRPLLAVLRSTSVQYRGPDATLGVAAWRVETDTGLAQYAFIDSQQLRKRNPLPADWGSGPMDGGYSYLEQTVALYRTTGCEILDPLADPSERQSRVSRTLAFIAGRPPELPPASLT